MALPNTNISTTLVADTLGASSRDVGTLCTHQAINKWSKWKPVRYGSVSPITEAQLASTNFGMSIPSSTTNNYLVALDEWVYIRPNNASGYRLGDFRNYHHTAVNPMHIFNPVSLNALQTVPIKLEAESAPSNNFQIGMSDFLNAENLYFGIVFKRDNGTLYAQTALTTLAQSGLSLELPTNSPILYGDYVDLYYIISNTRVSEAKLLADANITIMYATPAPDRHFRCNVINSIKDMVNIGFAEISTMSNSGFNSFDRYLVSGFDNQFFGTNGRGYVKMVLYNNTASSINITRANMAIGVSRLVTGEISSKYHQEPLLYNASGSAMTSVTIPANGSTTVVVGVNNLFTDMSLPIPGQTANSSIKLQWRYNNAWTDWDASGEIRVRAL